MLVDTLWATRIQTVSVSWFHKADPYHPKWRGSGLIRIHNTVTRMKKLLLSSGINMIVLLYKFSFIWGGGASGFNYFCRIFLEQLN